MPIQYRCPACRKLLSIGTRMAGQEMTCPSCGADHVVPSPRETAAPTESAAPGLAASGALGEPAERMPIEPEQTLLEESLGNSPVQDLEEEAEDDFDLRAFNRESDEMDLTPMVDCVFLLLIFFMITASFTVQKTIEVPAPDPDKKGATQSVQTLDDLERTSVVVTIDERNNIAVDDVPLGNPDAIADALRQKMIQEQKNELVVEAHASAFHETVVAVVDAAKEVQFQRIRLATTPGSEGN